MSVTSVTKDLDSLTMTVVAEFNVTVERCWQLWSDPRQLERWWGPPTYPATVEVHDLVPGGRIRYFMTGPEGDRYPGWWRVLEVDAPIHLVVQDGFSNEDGTPNVDLPTTIMRIDITTTPPDATATASIMTMTSTFPSIEAFEQLQQMGMEEGLLAAMSQIDAILAE